jgi:hypothetical protein
MALLQVNPDVNKKFVDFFRSDLEIREAIAVAEVITAGRVRSIVAESSVEAQPDQT